MPDARDLVPCGDALLAPRIARAFLLVVAAALAGCTAPGTADSFRDAHGSFAKRATATPLVSLIATDIPDGTIHKEQGEFELTQILLDSTVPVPQTRDSFLIVGALAGARHYDFEDVPVLADDTLHRYGLRLGYGAFVDDDLLLQGYWQPSIYSDLDGTLNSADYRLDYGAFVAVRRVNPDFFWKLGVLSSDAFDTGLIPLVGFTWHLHAQWVLQVLAPRDITLLYSIDDWYFSTGFLMDSDEYHVRSPASLGLEDDVNVQELTAHVTVERHLASGLSMLVRGGTTVAGNYDYGYGNGTDDLTGTLEPGWFASVGFTFRF